MHEVKRSALVMQTPGEMARLVRDVESYPEFLTWCAGARVLEQDATSQLAALSVKIGGIEQTFTTRNRLVGDERIHMDLEEGPFQHFSGCWTFTPLGEGCQVDLNLNFHFGNPLLAATFKRGFERMADRLVGDFCRRAEVVHG